VFCTFMSNNPDNGSYNTKGGIILAIVSVYLKNPVPLFDSPFRYDILYIRAEES
jgi:hypothetical protein